MSVTDQPTNLNFLSPVGYKFVLSRAPHLEYFIQRISLPGLTLGVAQQTSPFVNIPLPGDKIEFEQMQVQFRVNEDMDNYLEIFNWMVALGTPESFSQYTLINRPLDSANQQKDTVVSDISVSVLTSAMNSNVDFVMRDCFPINLSSIDMDSTMTDVDYVTATASFAIRDFTVTPV